MKIFHLLLNRLKTTSRDNLIMSVFIIAEAGVNHNGNINAAKELIDAAAASGADAVKFQTFKAEELVIPSARTALYQRKNLKDKSTQQEMLKKLELNEDQHRELIKYCKQKKSSFCLQPLMKRVLIF